MQNYVISLTSADQRRQHIEHEFNKHSIDFKFFDALTPQDAKPLAEKMQLDIHSERITGGELACFMSHVSLWQKMLDENIPYMAIFEDDIFLGENSNQFLSSSDWLKEDWAIVKLEAFSNKILLGKTEQIVNTSREIAVLKCKNLGTAGYILSQKGAAAYLELIKNYELIPLDEMMFEFYLNHGSLNIYQMLPALCIQEMMLFPEKKLALPSDLLQERKLRMKKFKKKGLTKFKAEISRIIKQVKLLCAGKILEFK
ncbi:MULTISPECIES: glycosyltransferase family 25 protein [unclassified Acinetobacter]|uniref:glycosyltransferase family 25 protein n=1 Tax=unclassified Acinetobacter TaxID=196816 RepID=UPI002934A3AD|nr:MULTISPECIES: glycosyltransferase family 25 protein [unclassified Acinetobacter]WOE31277.1 glycosyltransferase family 25 protein [Acinetobacter sp. SAAs470]WOE39473.1 glycosyltransferase family 25 protein [Acinetobacter sp. SAAs474]